MKTLQQLKEERAAAGAAWLDAVAALRAAYVNLAAHDSAVASGLVAGMATTARTFNKPLELPAHPDFPLPDWHDQAGKIRSRHEGLLGG
ncbi:hypothetical protein [Pseudomonas sp. PL-6]